MDAVDNVKNTFTSWDKCMEKAYCKWPVIAGIVIGSLILLSVLICVARCICCGAECVCCCFKCCGGCCGSGRKKGHNKLGSVSNTPFGGARGPGLPMYNNQYASAPPPVYQHNPFAQTATFDSPSGKIHEDSLPAMPSWETATSRQVEVVEEVKANPSAGESHELEKLNPQGQASTSPGMQGFAAAAVPARLPNQSSMPPSPYGENAPFLGQQSGVTRGDSYSGYAGAALAPQGYGYANQHTGPSQQSRNFSPRNDYQQQPSSDFYSQTGQGGAGYADQRSGGYETQYNESRQGYGGQYGDDWPGYDRQYSDQYNRPGYDRQFSNGSQHAQQNDYAASSVYSGTTAHDPNQGSYRAFSPAYTGGQQGRKPVNGSWREI